MSGGAGDLDAGSADAGSADAGEDGLQSLSAALAMGAPAALAYNGVDFDTTAAGDLASVHPIDSKVRLALLMKMGDLNSDPKQGVDWSTPFQWGERLTADVSDRIRDALRRSGIVIGTDIQEVRITVKSPVRGRVSWIYTYKNLRTGAEQIVNGNGA